MPPAPACAKPSLATLALVAALALGGCSASPSAPGAVHSLSFAVGAMPDHGAAGDASSNSDSHSLSAPTLDARAADAVNGTVRVSGRAFLPFAPPGLANVQDGNVSGAPVRITDATSGRLLARGVTYYDGSFLVDVPLAQGQKAALVSIALVDKTDPARTASLIAPVLLSAGAGETAVSLTPGSTAIVAFLSDLAATGAGVPPSSVGTLDGLGSLGPAGVGAGPSAATYGLSTLIAGLPPDGPATLSTVADRAPELRDPGSLAGLRAGIEKLAKRMGRGKISRLTSP